jgi:hypothetical protein
MKKKVNYKKIWCTFFGYAMSNDEFIPSEVSGRQAIDIHHIHPKQMGGKDTFIYDGITYDIDCIENLIALNRDEHTAAHDPTSKDYLTKDELWNIHKKKMEGFSKVSGSRINGK